LRNNNSNIIVDSLIDANTRKVFVSISVLFSIIDAVNSDIDLFAKIFASIKMLSALGKEIEYVMFDKFCLYEEFIKINNMKYSLKHHVFELVIPIDTNGSISIYYIYHENEIHIIHSLRKNIHNNKSYNEKSIVEVYNIKKEYIKRLKNKNIKNTEIQNILNDCNSVFDKYFNLSYKIYILKYELDNMDMHDFYFYRDAIRVLIEIIYLNIIKIYLLSYQIYLKYELDNMNKHDFYFYQDVIRVLIKIYLYILVQLILKYQ
jgi:hypothetical protein